MKTCYYELLGVERTATEADLKTAFRRKALQYHPDKNPDNVENTTAIFTTIRAAYEVLSDPQDRAWYDEHRDQILSDKPISSTGQDTGYSDYEVDSLVTGVTNEELLMFFEPTLYTRLDDSPAGLYQIAGKIFARLAKDEIINGIRLNLKDFELYHDRSYEEDINSLGYQRAFEVHFKSGNMEQMYLPGFGHSKTDYDYVKNFYKKWSGFKTLKSFSWKDEYMYSKSYDRRTKREINKRNEKSRQNARNEYNKTVKKFVDFVKKFDQRMKDGAKKLEQERKQQEHVKNELKSQQKISDHNRKVRNQFEVQEWQQIEETKWEDIEREYEDVDHNQSGSNNLNDFNINDLEVEEVVIYECFVCNRDFKSENQLKNHCNTKLHAKRVRELQKEMRKESMALGLDDVSDLENYDSAGDGDAKTELPQTTVEQLHTAENESDGIQSEHGTARINKPENIKNEYIIEVDHYDDINDESEFISVEYQDPNNSDFTLQESEESVDELSKILEKLQTGQLSDNDDDWNSARNSKTKPKLPRKKKDKNSQKIDSLRSTTVLPVQVGIVTGKVDKCVACNVVFDSRNKLFKHVKETGHAAPPDKVKGKKQSKRKVK